MTIKTYHAPHTQDMMQLTHVTFGNLFTAPFSLLLTREYLGLKRIKYSVFTNEWCSFQKLTRNLFLTLRGQNVHRQQRQLSQVSHALPAVRFQCLLRGRGASLQDGAAAGKDFLCVPC